jgi:hypothetical protein
MAMADSRVRWEAFNSEWPVGCGEGNRRIMPAGNEIHYFVEFTELEILVASAGRFF